MDEIALTIGSHPGLEDGSLELGVVGPLVHRTTHAMRDYLRILTNPHERHAAPQLYLNLSGCTNIDIHGLLALAVARQTARNRGGDLMLTHVPPLIAHRVRQLQFTDLLDTKQDNRP